MVNKLKRILSSNIAIALALFIFALGYYFICACKEFTWVFMSGDSADWLAIAKLTFLPQPFGAPTYVGLAKLIGLLPGDLGKNMVFYSSCLPAAISVACIYFAALKYKGRKILAIVASLVMISAFPFLAEASVVREHILSAMFLSFAVLAWSYKKYALVMIFGALAVSVNIIAGYICFLWVLVDLKNWRQWLKWIWLGIIFGLLPYGYTLWLMEYAPYKWFQANLSWANINDYLGASGTIGSLSILDARTRLIDFICVVFVSYGLALVPICKSFKKMWRFGLIAIGILWLYFMDNDPTTWTFTLYAVPFTAVMVAVGLEHKKEIIAVAISALILITMNGFFLNAQTIHNENPVAEVIFNDTMALPENSVVVTSQGGFVTLNMFYAISKGSTIEMIFANQHGTIDNVGYLGWVAWANSRGLQGGNSVEMARFAIQSGRQVFRVTTFLPEAYVTIVDKNNIQWQDENIIRESKGLLIKDIYIIEPYNEYYNKVVAVK